MSETELTTYSHGRNVPLHFGDREAEAAALLGDGALVDTSVRETLRLTGADALSFLQTKLTANTKRWPNEGGSYTLGTDINGKTLFDAIGVMIGDEVFLSLTPGNGAAAREHLERYIILEDAEIADVSDQYGSLVATGGALEALASAIDERGISDRVALLRTAAVPAGGAAVLGPRDDIASLYDTVVQGGATPAGWSSLERAEVLAGVARFGVDIRPGETIPLEAGAWHGISLAKGCYLGQEVIERLYSRGKPNKRLMTLRWEGAAVEADTPLTLDGKKAGFITRSEANGEVTVALGYVRRKALEADTVELADTGISVRIGDYVGGERPEDDRR